MGNIALTFRGNTVNYFVEDGLYNTEDVPLPAPDSNVIISDITGTCSTEGPCYSVEDPKFPDVSASYGDSAVVVWHQKYSSALPIDLDVMGDFLTYSGEPGACGFTDVPAGYWAEDFICKIYDAGITGGCSQSPLKYCPEGPVTRAQMAVFLGRGIHGSDFAPPAASGIFSDVPTTYWASKWIEQFYSDGITGGCGTGPLRYCPESLVTRAQMAVFLLRSKYGSSYNPPAASGIFADVPVSYWAAAWIEQLYTEGITGGCGSSPF